LRLAVAAAAAFPLLAWLTGVSVNANLSVFGFDAVGAGIELHGSIPMAVLLGAAWGAAAGGIGALLALVTGAAGRRSSPYALGHTGEAAAASDSSRMYPGIAYQPGPYLPSPVYQPERDEPNPYKQPPPRPAPHSAPTVAGHPKPPLPPRRRVQRPGTPPPDAPPPPGPPRGRP